MPHDGYTRLVQLSHPDEGRRAALVYENELHLLATYRSVYSFAMAALETGWKLRDLLSTDLSGIVLDYAEVHALHTPWLFLPAFDDPHQPARCLVSTVSASRGWQYLGSADCLRGHGQDLTITDPDSGVAPDLAAVYVVGNDERPRRVGVTMGVGMAIGPELILDPDVARIDAEIMATREGRRLWSHLVSARDAPLGLALAAIEPDHFRRAGHRRPGDSHVHFFGARLFGDSPGRVLEDGDEIVVRMDGFGLPLRTAVKVEQPAACVAVPL